MKLFWLGVLGFALSGCVVVPGAGPTTGAITDNSAALVRDGETVEPFALFSMNLNLAKRVNSFQATPPPSSGFFADEPGPAFVLAPGDKIAVTVISVDSNGFLDFTQSAISPISTTPLPDQLIAADGRIQVPPLGRVRAAGRTPQGLERNLTAALRAELIDPSVVVQTIDRDAARASVLGRVNNPGSFPLLREDLHLVELISLAGGPDGPVEDLVLSLNRDGVVRGIPLETALSEPSANIRVWPSDVVTIEGRRRRFAAVGAVTAPGFYEYDRPSFTLSDALGRARGALSNRAARNGVFVYRTVPTDQIAAFGADTADFPGAVAPAIYHFNFLSPTMYFAAQNFEMADGDVIYVSDSLATEISKVLGIVTQVGQSPNQIFINNLP